MESVLGGTWAAVGHTGIFSQTTLSPPLPSLPCLQQLALDWGRGWGGGGSYRHHPRTRSAWGTIISYKGLHRDMCTTRFRTIEQIMTVCKRVYVPVCRFSGRILCLPSTWRCFRSRRRCVACRQCRCLSSCVAGYILSTWDREDSYY